MMASWLKITCHKDKNRLYNNLRPKIDCKQSCTMINYKAAKEQYWQTCKGRYNGKCAKANLHKGKYDGNLKNCKGELQMEICNWGIIKEEEC